MQFVSTTAIACFAALALLRLGPSRGLWVFFALMPLGAAAAFNLSAVGDASILLADVGALALVGATLLRKDAPASLLEAMRPFRPGFILVALFLFAAFATAFFPRLFVGQTEVFGIARVDGIERIALTPIGPTTGNITQLFRLALGMMVFIALAAVFQREPDPKNVITALVAGTFVHCAFGAIDVITYNLGLDHLMDLIRTANYAMASDQVMAGLKRMVGAFPEASAFGYHSLGLFGFWLSYWFDKGRFRYAAWFLLAATAVVVLSTSSSAYVATALFLMFFLAANARQVLNRQMSRRVAIIFCGVAALLPIALAALIVGYQASPGFTDYLDRVLFDKLESNSGVERMSWNVQAMQNFFDTWTIGLGVGSVRASNWMVANLASFGLLGTLAYIAFLVSVFRCKAPGHGEATIVVRALKMGCLALLARALITKSTPNLELSFFAMAGIVEGLSRGVAALRLRAPLGLVPSEGAEQRL